jgi:hypothetical protein
MADEKEVKEITEVKEEELKKYSELDQKAMYWFYFGLGEKRSLHKVALHFGTKEWVIKELSRKNDWIGKCNEAEKLLNSEEVPTENKLLEYFDYVQFGIITDILNDSSVKPNEKLKAMEALNELAKRSAEIKLKKRIIIDFKNEDELKSLIEGKRNFGNKTQIIQ